MFIHNLQVAVVTGATCGIGLEVSKALALARARVLLLSRKTEHGDEAVSAIKSESPDADVRFMECDLGNLHDVKAVGDRICASEERIDIVVADAGVGVYVVDGKMVDPPFFREAERIIELAKKCGVYHGDL